MVNYFLVGLANRRAEITRRGTKRPLRCIGQRESRYAEGKDRENWTCSRLIFFSFFLLVSHRVRNLRAGDTTVHPFHGYRYSTLSDSLYRLLSKRKICHTMEISSNGAISARVRPFFFFFSVCQWHGNNECYDWVKRSIEISVCYDL